MNKPSQCRCPFQLISDICQCHISPCNPSVINHLQQTSHSPLGISEHAEGKVAALVILLMPIHSNFHCFMFGGKRQKCTDLSDNANQIAAQEPTHGHAARQGLLPTPVLTAFSLCPTPASPRTSEQVPCSGNSHRLLQFLLE